MTSGFPRRTNYADGNIWGAGVGTGSGGVNSFGSGLNILYYNLIGSSDDLTYNLGPMTRTVQVGSVAISGNTTAKDINFADINIPKSGLRTRDMIRISAVVVNAGDQQLDFSLAIHGTTAIGSITSRHAADAGTVEQWNMMIHQHPNAGSNDILILTAAGPTATANAWNTAFREVDTNDANVLRSGIDIRLTYDFASTSSTNADVYYSVEAVHK